jgi:hypothetical protein
MGLDENPSGSIQKRNEPVISFRLMALAITAYIAL